MLVSLNDLKSFLGIPLLDLSQDAFLTLQIELVSEAVEAYCNRAFGLNTYTQTFYASDIADASKLPLYHYPLAATPTAVEKDSAGNSTAVADFRHHAKSGVITRNSGRFFSNGNIVEVTYQAGYAVLPALVKNVIMSVAGERYNKKVNGIDLSFGSDIQRIAIAGTISVDFDFSLSTNDRKSHLGSILGVHLNVLDVFRSERTVTGNVISYVV